MSLFLKASHRNIFLSCVAAWISFSVVAANDEEAPPNVLIIMTDEHNLRTLGCYRDLMVKSQAEIWGEGVTVSTPNLDSLAKNGALFSNFMTVSPACTPSRGSFLTGTYPSTNKALRNHVPMRDDAITFAETMKEKLAYETSYMGKWHMNGDLYSDEVFGAPADRSFGFDDTKYQWNRGHWKFIQEKSNGSVKAYSYEDGEEIFDSPESKRDAYTTDFITNRAIEYINKQAGSASRTPFTLMLSYPDPHGPHDVREPYNTMFDDLHFAFPQNAVLGLNKQPAPPAWSRTKSREIRKGVPLDKVKEKIELYENSEYFQLRQRQSFGMIKLLDDSVGRILKTLEDNNMKNDTIVVFTSDHGGTMGEHNSAGKGTPYKTSAGVPFLIQWPRKIPAGKHIETAYSFIDFVPTLFNLVGIDTSELGLTGLDASEDLINENMLISDENQFRFIDQAKGKWAAAVSERYKFVLSSNLMQPYLLDSAVDPNELTNFFNQEGYKDISKKMRRALLQEMEEHDFQLMKRNAEVIYLEKPACQESRDQLDGDYIFTVCANYKKAALQDECQNPALKAKCPVTCNACSKEWGKFMWKKRFFSCSKVARKPLKIKKKWCKKWSIGNFCRKACAKWV